MVTQISIIPCQFEFYSEGANMKIWDLEWVGYRWLARAALLTLLVLTVLMAASMRWWDFSGMALFILLFMVYLYIEKDLPLIYDCLVSFSLLLNAMGWVYNYYQSISIYDEFAHCFTSFTLSLIAGIHLIRPWEPESRSRPAQTSILYFLMAMGIGALWELAEWIAYLMTADKNIIKSLEDTILDLFWNGLGGVLSLPLFFLTRLQYKSKTKDRHSGRLYGFFGLTSRFHQG